MSRSVAFWPPVLVAGLCVVLIAALGGTITDIGPWYLSLKQPDWKPDDALFAPIWTTIFLLAALAGIIAWRRWPADETRSWIIGLFALNGFLNILWSLLFFRAQRPDWALYEVPFLWLSVLALMIYLGRRSPWSAVLLLPYLVWVSIAAVLNNAVVDLNAPF